MSTIASRAASVAQSTRVKRLLFLSYVRSQLGVPYVWGGASTTGFDCSGLVMWAAAKLGIELPHYTVDQWNQLPEVTKPLAGDLVYFYVPSDGPASAQPGHVGICANAGCSIMINAPAPGGVVDEVSTDPAGWGSIMGYRSVVGGGDAGPLGPAGPVAPPNPGRGQVAAAQNAKGAGDKSTAVGCSAKGNVFGEGGLPVIHTGSFSFTYCEAKALIGGLCIAAGGTLMLVGGVLLAVYGLQKVGLAPTPGEVKGAVVGAVAGAAGGPEGMAAGAASGARSGAKQERSKVYAKVRDRFDRDEQDARRADEADRKAGAKLREQRGREAMNERTVVEGADRPPAFTEADQTLPPRRERRQKRQKTSTTVST